MRFCSLKTFLLGVRGGRHPALPGPSNSGFTQFGCHVARESNYAAMREDLHGYGQELSENLLEWEVYSPGFMIFATSL